MSEYKRMVAYLYKYERGKKGQNAGYVRIDVRQGSLKLIIHAQDEKALKDKDFQVYFYYHDKGKLKGVLGGSLRFQKGEGRYRGETKENSLFDSGHSLDKMGGMLLYYNSDLAYGTEWDDKPIIIQKFEEEARRKEEPEQKEEEIPSLEREERDIRESKMEEEEKAEEENMESVEEQREEQEQQDILTEEENEEIELEQEVELEEEREAEEEIALEEEGVKENQGTEEKAEEAEEPEQEMGVENNVIWKSSDLTPKNDWIPFYEEEMQEQDVVESSIPEEDHLGNLEESFFDVPGLTIDQDTFLGLQAIYNGSSIGKTEDMLQCDFSELQSYPLNHKEKTSEELINDLLSQCPKVNHPTNHQIMLMVRIHPQDIGKLSISNWHFGSNSFLIHGYYQFHYIVIGRIMTLDGTMQSIIGVPGLYNNQEKYMALQFGFRDFLSVKPTQIKTGSFGYWIAKLS